MSFVFIILILNIFSVIFVVEKVDFIEKKVCFMNELVDVFLMYVFGINE